MSRRAVIDLFSGCGGSALGFKTAGFEIKAAVDSDKNSAITYRKNNPGTFFFEGDIRNLPGETILSKSGIKKNECFAILACPPCQGFSLARRVSQRNDPRNGLVFEFVRLVEEISPEFIVMENVPGLSGGEGKKMFIEAVDNLNGMGYRTISNVLNASDFGVPQKRKRLILIGSKLPNINLNLPIPDFGPDKKKRLTVRDAIGNLRSLKVGETDPDDPMHRSKNLSELNLQRLKFTPKDGGSRTDWPEFLTLKCHKNKSGHYDVYGRMRWDEPSPTLTGGCTCISKGRFGHPEQDRAISLREAARLQSFPDDYVFSGGTGSISEQIGNSVPPVLAQKIGFSILNIINE